jgi:hypothetical protein
MSSIFLQQGRVQLPLMELLKGLLGQEVMVVLDLNEVEIILNRVKHPATILTDECRAITKERKISVRHYTSQHFSYST